jgi:hypothetical protein
MTNANLLSEMEKDAEKGQITNDKLTELSDLVLKFKELEEAIKEEEEYLKKLKEDYDAIGMGKIPDLFDSLSLSQLKLKTGEVVEIKRDFAATITAEKQEECFNWLKENGHESIIKHDVVTTIKKGETIEYEKLLSALNSLGVTYTDKSYVHPMTLKSFVKEQINSGINFPQEQFSVFPIRKTKIK